MLVTEKQRISIAEILNHPFILNNHSDRVMKRHDSYSKYLKNLNFQEFSNLKKVILTSIATRLSFSEINKLHDIFLELDTNNDGNLSLVELERGMKKFCVDYDQKFDVSKIFISIDTNNSKKIDYSEFIAATIDSKFYENKNKLLETFEYFDFNQDGEIDYGEFEKILKMHHSENFEEKNFDEFKKEFVYYDINKDGKIDYNEFVDIVLKKKDEFYPKKKSKVYLSFLN